MAQLDPSRYKRLTAPYGYASSDGLYYDTTATSLVLVIGGTVIDVITAAGHTGDLEVTSEARGDILRRGASAWERLSAKTSGQILVGDGTDVVSVAVSGDATLSAAGAVAVTDLSLASEARGDLARRGAAAWERVSAKTAGAIVCGDGTDVISAVMSGDATLSAAGALTLAATQCKYVKVPVSSGELLAINASPKTLVAAAAGYIHIVHRATLVLNYNSAAYANNGVLGIYETNSAGTLLTGTLTLASFLAQTADTIKELHPLAHSATTGLTRVDNKALVLTQATGESITGDSPVDVHLWYSTIPHGL